MEQWKKVEGFERYCVNSKGEVLNTQGKVLKPFCSGAGYLQVTLWNDSRKKKFYVHRLVADAFVDNPCGYKEINHIDGNKKNNPAANLEWCSRKENLLHSYYTLCNHVKAVKCLETGVVYPSIHEAARQTGVSRNGISMCCDGRQQKAGKLHWGYAI